MDSPIDKIPEIIKIIIGSKENNKLCAEEIKKYYRDDVEYKHFLTYIHSSHNSRERLIALNKFNKGYIWSDCEIIHDIWFNDDSLKAIIDVTQIAKRGIWFWFNYSTRLLIKLDLSYDTNGKYVIRKQEVFIHPEELAAVGMFYGLVNWA
nr:6200_t:CDS:2 [Entrophospora candida]CAG8452627.1 10362_t:CDS:2 [Entrophospora candida]